MQTSRLSQELHEEQRDPEPAIREERLSTIGDLSRDFGVSLRALRFYEDRGLLHPHRRGTARYYDERDKHNLRLILKGKQLGFTLAEIHEVLAAGPADSTVQELELALPPEQIAAQISHLERRRQELDQAILDLRDAHRRLVETAAHSLSS